MCNITCIKLTPNQIQRNQTFLHGFNDPNESEINVFCFAKLRYCDVFGNFPDYYGAYRQS